MDQNPTNQQIEEEDYHPYMGREKRKEIKESQERMKKMLKDWRHYRYQWGRR